MVARTEMKHPLRHSNKLPVYYVSLVCFHSDEKHFGRQERMVKEAMHRVYEIFIVLVIGKRLQWTETFMSANNSGSCQISSVFFWTGFGPDHLSAQNSFNGKLSGLASTFSRSASTSLLKQTKTEYLFPPWRRGIFWVTKFRISNKKFRKKIKRLHITLYRDPTHPRCSPTIV